MILSALSLFLLDQTIPNQKKQLALTESNHIKLDQKIDTSEQTR